MPKVTDNTGKPFEKIGTLLRNLRLRRGLSQFDLASSAGINNSYLSRIENGERRPSPKILKKFSEILHHPYDDLVVSSGILSEEFVRSTPPRFAEPGVDKTTQALQQLITTIQDQSVPGVQPAGIRQRVPVPIYDTVPAGLLKDANVVDAHSDIPQLLLTEDELGYDPQAFGLVVQGDSMVEAGILDGDTLIVSPNTKAASGDIAVVLVNQRTTSVKKVYFEESMVILQPANSNYQLQVLRYPDEVEVLGKVILVRRKLM